MGVIHNSEDSNQPPLSQGQANEPAVGDVKHNPHHGGDIHSDLHGHMREHGLTPNPAHKGGHGDKR